MSDATAVESLTQTIRPDLIFQLAADSTTGHDSLRLNHGAIATGTLNVLEAVRKFVPNARVFVTGSGLQFANGGRPISERDDFVARDSYSLARIHAAHCARYFRSLGLRVVVGYLFHHDSPLRRSRHLAKMVSDSVREIVAGKRSAIYIGDLDVVREWGFAGDIADGMVKLTLQDDVSEATIGTGVGHSVGEWIDACFRHAGLDAAEFVKTKAGYRAPFSRLVADTSTMSSIGWRANTSFEAMVAMMMEIPEPDT